MYCGTGSPSPFVSKNGARYHINSGYTGIIGSGPLGVVRGGMWNY